MNRDDGTSRAEDGFRRGLPRSGLAVNRSTSENVTVRITLAPVVPARGTWPLPRYESLPLSLVVRAPSLSVLRLPRNLNFKEDVLRPRRGSFTRFFLRFRRVVARTTEGRRPKPTETGYDSGEAGKRRPRSCARSGVHGLESRKARRSLRASQHYVTPALTAPPFSLGRMRRIPDPTDSEVIIRGTLRPGLPRPRPDAGPPFIRFPRFPPTAASASAKAGRTPTLALRSGFRLRGVQS